MGYPDWVEVSRGTGEVRWSVGYWKYAEREDKPEERQYDITSSVESIESDQWFPTSEEAEDWIRGRLGI